MMVSANYYQNSSDVSEFSFASDTAISAVDFQIIQMQHENDDAEGRDSFEGSAVHNLDRYGIPEYLSLKESMKSSNLNSIVMSEIVFNKNNGNRKVVTNLVDEGEILSSQNMIRKNTGKYGSLVFVVRRPGCYICREEGQALTILAKKYPELVKGFKIFGVVKEVGVDDQGLHKFHDQYFPFPLYRDANHSFYKALGYRKVKPSFLETLSYLKKTVSFKKRADEKKITGNFIGEGFIKGGVIIFDKQGEPKYAYEEVTGAELPLPHLVKALNTIRKISRTSY